MENLQKGIDFTFGFVYDIIAKIRMQGEDKKRSDWLSITFNERGN